MGIPSTVYDSVDIEFSLLTDLTTNTNTGQGLAAY
jgi:hypothetical protein